MRSVGVLGGGAWGTALAAVAAGDGTPTLLWAREAEVIAGINAAHRNEQFLPGVALSPLVTATGDLAHVAARDVVMVVAPAQHVRTLLMQLALLPPRPLVLCAKGIEAGSLQLVSEVAATVLPGWPVAVLSGPTFAAEVAAGLPTAVTLACADAELGAALVQRLARATFRPYLSDDVVGAEVGGAVKNVLAIACGVVIGAGLGENARAAVISRGYAEMLRFGLAKGAAAATLGGLSGLGDLVLTCGSVQSRNMSLGVALGQGRRVADVLGERRSVAEGAATAPVLQAAAARLGIDMPIVVAVAALLAGEAGVAAVIERLLSRPLRTEG